MLLQKFHMPLENRFLIYDKKSTIYHFNNYISFRNDSESSAEACLRKDL